MNTKLIIGMAAALLMAGTAAADDYQRSVAAPSTLDITGVVVFGVAACENVLGASSPAFCGTGGVSAIIDISGDSEISSSTMYVTGKCGVTPSAPGVGADYTFSCGTDRDDDTFVTNSDALVGPGSDSFDDDFVDGGSNAATEIDITCFRRDLGDVAAPDPQAINNAGADFDDIAFFIATPVGSSTNPFVGFLNVDLKLDAGTSTCDGLSAPGNAPVKADPQAGH